MVLTKTSIKLGVYLQNQEEIDTNTYKQQVVEGRKIEKNVGYKLFLNVHC